MTSNPSIEMTGTLAVEIRTLGCKANRYDSSAIEDLLSLRGFKVTEGSANADAYIINTCTVTARTDYHSRQEIRRIRRLNPDAVIIVTGCYAQVSPQEISSMEGVDYVLGNPQKEMVCDLISRGRTKKTEVIVGAGEEGTPLSLRARSSGGRTRANLKVQDGCNRLCSYCIIPKARGVARSVRPELVIGEIEGLIEAGYKEIILTGIHLGAYGVDLPAGTDLFKLLALIEKRAFKCRFRISSLDPDEVTDELMELVGGAGTLCNHLHIALQSGSDKVLRDMRRPYTAEAARMRLEAAFRKIAGLSIGADVIAGFPGEGPEEFETTCRLLTDLPLSYMHVFPFSVRKGTTAAGMQGRIDKAEIKKRCMELNSLDKKKRKAFFKASTGTPAQVLIEGGRDKATGAVMGRSRNYIPVILPGVEAEKGDMIEATLLWHDDKDMIGRIIKGV